MSRLVFLIASHKNPDQVCKLIQTLKSGSPEAFILVHHDHSKSTLDISSLAHLDNVHVLEKHIAVNWGEFSVVESELYCFQWLFEHGIEFDWLVLLSGQDYPIKPIVELDHLLAFTEYDGFFEYFLAEAPPVTAWGWGQNLGKERYYYRYHTVNSGLKPLFFKLYRPVNWQHLVRVKAGRFGAKIAVRRQRTIFSDEFRCYAGSQWHILNHRCVTYIQDFIQKRPEVVEYYRHTMVPDESFFQTILVNNPDLRLCNDNLRHIDWRPPYPAIMQSDDFDTLIHSGKFFARKFDITVDVAILDRLDNYRSSNPLNNQTTQFSNVGS